MHGEYKVPGGKLVVVDLEVRDGRIADFHLAGDFFLEPDTALDDIDAAVNGLPVEADVTTIAAAVRAALPEGAQLLGFTPESVGTAVRRALVTAPGWRDFDWEIVHEAPVSPRMNLALDEVLTEPRGRRPSQPDPAPVGVERVRRRHRLVPVATATRSTPRARPSTGSTSSAASRAVAPCSWRRTRS